MSFTSGQRAHGWNVKFYSYGKLREDGLRCVGGVFQRDGLLTMADIVYELDLCFLAEEPGAGWQPALLARDTDTEADGLVLLDQESLESFPTPPLGGTTRYDYVFHNPSKCMHPPVEGCRSRHSLGDKCIQCYVVELRSLDPRYLEIGKRSLDQRLQGFHRRSVSVDRGGSARSPSTRQGDSTSRDPSLSPTRTETTDNVIPEFIASADARSRISQFRGAVFDQCQQCVITGLGNFRNMPGPGLEAAHVVPQSQWNTYPIHGKAMADHNSIDELIHAWEITWSAIDNGIMLESHLHRMFVARLLSIHPITKTVRCFINYDAATPYHGVVARLPENFPRRVLQYHWDMCILENTPMTRQAPRRLTNVPDLGLPPAKFMKINHGDPYKDNLTTRGSGAGASTGASGSGAGAFSGASGQVMSRPPSPPLSERDSVQCHWKGTMTRGPDVAQGLMTEVGLAQEVSDDEDSYRGRSRVKRRCIAAEDMEDDSHKQIEDDGRGEA